VINDYGDGEHGLDVAEKKKMVDCDLICDYD
jgi:hypothetical protein